MITKERLHPIFDAFSLYDQEGLPLSVSMEAARAKGMRINLAAFACDAIFAGWSLEKLRRELESACSDQGEAFSWDDFQNDLGKLWVLCGSGPDPECWTIMKQRLLETSRKKLE